MRAAQTIKALLPALVVATCALLPADASAAPPAAASAAIYAVRPVCPRAIPGHLRCDALELVPRHARATTADAADTPNCHPPLASEGCDGLRPQDLHAAYDLPAEAPSPQTIAIVSAGNDRTAATDLAVYDAEFELPPCTTENHCLTVLNGAGQRKPLPPSSSEAGEETSIDLQVAHAVCPNCALVLLEASSTSLPAFEEAEETAGRLPSVTEISNSWGEIEPAEPPRGGAAFNHPGIVVTAAAGDTGFDNWGSPEGQRDGVEYPASSPDVIAVGGTALTVSENGEWLSETPWEAQAGAGGSGCSDYFTAPPWQRSLPNWATVGCRGMRALADLAVDGDPYTGVAIYDSTKNAQGIVPQWKRLGGTSVGAPLVAAAFALAGGAHGIAYPAQTLYADATRLPGAFHDVTSGSNGECELLFAEECTVEQEAASCEGTAICVAGPGYDGPTGVGTVDGVAALTPLPPLLVQQVEFTTAAPTGATVGGAPYTVAAVASSGLPVALSSPTPAVCELQGVTVSFLSAGTCILAADQQGNGEYEPAVQVTQSFGVAARPSPTPETQTLSFMSSQPPADSSFALLAPPQRNLGGTILLTASVHDAGSFRWLFTFANGSFGVVEGGAKKCGAGTIRLAGGCRPAQAIFAEGHVTVAAGTVELTMRPGSAGALALRGAERSGRSLRLVAVVRFQSAQGGAPYTRTLTLVLRPPKASARRRPN